MKKQTHIYRIWEVKIIQFVLILLFIIAGCSSTRDIGRHSGNATDTGYYRNHVNSGLIRMQIEEGFRSILRIQNNVIYRTYQFYLDELPSESEVHGQNLNEISVQSYLDDQSTAGTAIVLTEFRGRYALLTAAHTVSYPDTIWHYHDDSPDPDDPLVEAVSVRQSVNHFVIMENGIVRLELGPSDMRRDLAIMTNINQANRNLMAPLSLPIGNSQELGWGDMVYALGYPKGAKMVTMGTASRSDHPTRSILIDASFNRGFSGGALFAVRNADSGLEFMGIVTSALGENETYLTPEISETKDFDPDVPYTGQLYVRNTPRINYGITNAVAINEIMEFFIENEEEMNDLGMIIP
ncbi:S1 family peptidase [Rhodohalobacter sp. 614A]|uniref:S1 family peptidase n=1 Tax=Rhodohalobacter sp. 614A TaxID=2908649 RepID=UPI001F461690|nr:serine protease [Rhodohalobacter sp. 614A]